MDPQKSGGLMVLRLIFFSQLFAGVVILVVLFVITSEIGRIEIPLALAPVGLGLYGIAAAHWATRRPLKVDSLETLAQSYRTNFFMGYAMNEAPLLICFVIALVEGTLWPYLMVLPFWAFGMEVIAPSSKNIQRRQEQIQAQGSTLSLVEALSGSTSPN